MEGFVTPGERLKSVLLARTPREREEKEMKGEG